LFERLNVAPAYRIIFEALERQILNGALPVGSALPTETDLAGQFGVTRHTVREGIRMLEETGVVRREAGRRLHVSLPRQADLASRSSRALIMQKVSFRELWEVSVDLETAAAERAAERITDEMIERLRENTAAMAATLDTGGSIIALDVAFHQIIAEATGNKALLLAREPISALFHPALDTLFQHPAGAPVAPLRLLEAHRQVLRGLESRDAEWASSWMRKHMVDFRRGYALCGLDMDEPIQAHTHP
jgi:GntR family transcriptional regulator, transcriptional repressor for pyruvate dehydrogenase complex